MRPDSQTSCVKRLDGFNEPLSLRHVLQDRGVKTGRIELVGRGSRDPRVANETTDNQARNRRVEIFQRDPHQVS
jgi:hypothetical protein